MGSLRSSLDKPSRDSFKEGGVYRRVREVRKTMPGARVRLPGATKIVPGEQGPGLRMEAEDAGRVPARRASFWPRDPPQSPGAQRHPRLVRAARDCQQPPAREEHLPIRGFRGQLCPSAILKSSDIFHGDREVGRRGNGRVSASRLCRSKRRGEERRKEAGEEAAIKL